MRKIYRFIIAAMSACVWGHALAHDPGEARYLANEGVMVSSGETKILFDPLPLTGFGTYPDLPADMKQKLMAGTPPYDGIDAIFISHAHRDHFSAKDIIAYKRAHPDVKLVMPAQALDMIAEEFGPDGYDEAEWKDGLILSPPMGRMIDLPSSGRHMFGDVEIFHARIPHSGWPNSRTDIQNMLYRVTLDDKITVMHMGDADARGQHFAPYKEVWAARKTDMVFPPYWFSLTPGAEQLLQEFMNAEKIVGVHVPIQVPENLKASGADYFDEPGETRVIHLPHKTDLGDDHEE